MTARGLTARGQPPSLRLRRLAAELRALRQAVDLTREAVAQRTELNSATLWRIETARARPQRRTLLALMDLYGVADEDRRTALIGLAQPAPADQSSPAGGRPLDGYATLVAFEAQAGRLRLFEWRFVPDLLQTDRYARAVLAGLRPGAGAGETAHLTTLRRRRHARLGADPPIEVEVVLDESALHRRIGGGRVHRDQLRELAAIARAPQVTLRVLPYDEGAHAGLHGAFTLVDFPDPADAGLVFVETGTGPAFLEGTDDLAGHLARFERLRAAALDPDRTLDLLTRLAGSAEPVS